MYLTVYVSRLDIVPTFVINFNLHPIIAFCASKNSFNLKKQQMCVAKSISCSSIENIHYLYKYQVLLRDFYWLVRLKVFQNMAPCFYCLANSENSCSSCNNISYCSKQHFDIHKSTSGECLPVSINFDQKCGKYCIATKDIKSFDVVLEDTAIAWGTYDDSKPLCLVCLKRADLTIKCEFCNLPMCGSKECMNSPIHTPECEVLRNHQPQNLKSLEITLFMP